MLSHAGIVIRLDCAKRLTGEHCGHFIVTGQQNFKILNEWIPWKINRHETFFVSSFFFETRRPTTDSHPKASSVWSQFSSVAFPEDPILWWNPLLRIVLMDICSKSYCLAPGRGGGVQNPVVYHPPPPWIWSLVGPRPESNLLEYPSPEIKSFGVPPPRNRWPYCGITRIVFESIGL
jgi:hypothetical protein